jgi:phage terminase large subunit
LNSDDPKVIKEDDHTCDAFQYYVNDNLQKLNLKY